MRIKRMFFYVILSLASYSACSAVSINFVDNQSSRAVEILVGHIKRTVDAQRSVNVRPLLEIPYLSALDDSCRDQFLKDEQYIPKDALLVTTQQGTFALWRNQIGVYCALLTLRHRRSSRAMPRCLLKTQSSSRSNVTLITDTQGAVSLQ